MEQFMPHNCDPAARIFDDLLQDLFQAGQGASEGDKLEQFRIAIEGLKNSMKPLT